MKIIGSVREDLSVEKRISITPESVKKLKNLNLSIFLEKNYGEHLGINDEEYKNEGANFYSSAKDVLEKSEIILKVGCPTNNEIKFMKIATSLKSLKKRDLNSRLVRRRGRVYIINKKNPKFKARQK